MILAVPTGSIIPTRADVFSHPNPPRLARALAGLSASVCHLAGDLAQAFDEKQWQHPRPAHGFVQKTYCRVVRPIPDSASLLICGGLFVEAGNRRFTRCIDGRRAKECHAAVIDLSALGLTSDRGGAGHGRFREQADAASRGPLGARQRCWRRRPRALG